MTLDAGTFFREEATVEHLTLADSFSGDQFDAPKFISVRWFVESQQIQTRDGREIVTLGRVSTMTPLREGDRLVHQDGHVGRVVRVRQNRDTSGRFSHYVADLRGGV